jgi:hypothetical protein
MESVLFVLPRKLQFRSPPRAGDSGACRSDLRHAVASFPRHGTSGRLSHPDSPCSSSGVCTPLRAAFSRSPTPLPACARENRLSDRPCPPARHRSRTRCSVPMPTRSPLAPATPVARCLSLSDTTFVSPTGAQAREGARTIARPRAASACCVRRALSLGAQRRVRVPARARICAPRLGQSRPARVSMQTSCAGGARRVRARAAPIPWSAPRRSARSRQATDSWASWATHSPTVATAANSNNLRGRGASVRSMSNGHSPPGAGASLAHTLGPLPEEAGRGPSLSAPLAISAPVRSAANATRTAGASTSPPPPSPTHAFFATAAAVQPTTFSTPQHPRPRPRPRRGCRLASA